MVNDINCEKCKHMEYCYPRNKFILDVGCSDFISKDITEGTDNG